MHGELSTLLLFQPAWHLAQISPEVLLLLGTSRETGKTQVPQPGTPARAVKRFSTNKEFGGRKGNRSCWVMGAPRTGFPLTVLGSCKATSQLHKMLIAGQGPGKSSLEFSREREPGISSMEEPDGQRPGAASAGTATTAQTHGPEPAHFHPGRRGTFNTCKQ